MNDTYLNENEETFELPKPEVRKELPNDVLGYLERTYPARVNGAGIKQSDKVDYITEERTFMKDENIKTVGLDALGLLWFLRLKMSEALGWGIDVTEKEYKKMVFELAIDLDLQPNQIHEICNRLIDKGIIKVVKGSDGKVYWTTMQQFYNYEYKNWTRIKNNYASRKRNKAKQENIQSQNNLESANSNTVQSNQSNDVPESQLEKEDENCYF